MIELKQGNLLEENAEALVNTVNCVGVMGKGIALQFKQAYPNVFKAYKKACDAKEVQPGQMFTVETGQLFPRYIINFPTKRHWRGKSKIEDIDTGLAALVAEVKHLGIRSLAIPPLGCGNGGLDWPNVKTKIIAAFQDLSDVQVVLFEPKGAPSAEQMQVATKKPNMTLGRALIIRLLDIYGIPGYRSTKIEIQKLAYFLQVAGQPLKLRYVKHKFGPYADNLNHVLQHIEAHFIQGYGDRTNKSQISVLPDGREQANRFLAKHTETKERLNRVSDLITGYETPYGLEMLATLHWVAQEDPIAAQDCDYAISKVQEWNERKRQIFKPSHLRKAWHRLHEQNWLTPELSQN